jgi:hypothetical protein
MHNFLFLGCLKRAVLSLMPLAGGILEKKWNSFFKSFEEYTVKRRIVAKNVVGAIAVPSLLIKSTFQVVG